MQYLKVQWCKVPTYNYGNLWNAKKREEVQYNKNGIIDAWKPEEVAQYNKNDFVDAKERDPIQ